MRTNTGSAERTGFDEAQYNKSTHGDQGYFFGVKTACRTVRRQPLVDRTRNPQSTETDWSAACWSGRFDTVTAINRSDPAVSFYWGWFGLVADRTWQFQRLAHPIVRWPPKCWNNKHPASEGLRFNGP